MQDIYLSKIDPESNTFRFYRLTLPSGSNDLMLQWGRIGEYLTESWEAYASHDEALKHLASIRRSKEASGYVLSDQRVMPKNHLFHHKPEAVLDVSGQLSFFDLDSD